MTLDQARANWIASPKRVEVNEMLTTAIEAAIQRVLPQVPPNVVDLVVRSAIAALDEAAAHPVQVHAMQAVVHDHRKD